MEHPINDHIKLECFLIEDNNPLEKIDFQNFLEKSEDNINLIYSFVCHAAGIYLLHHQEVTRRYNDFIRKYNFVFHFKDNKEIQKHFANLKYEYLRDKINHQQLGQLVSEDWHFLRKITNKIRINFF